MLLFRAISADEYDKLMKGEKIVGEKDFSTYYRDTTSRGICFFKVDSLDDDEILVKDRYEGINRYVNIDTILQLTGNYHTYKYGIFIEVPDDRGLRAHGTYQSDRCLYTVPEICFKAYRKGVVKKVITL